MTRRWRVAVASAEGKAVSQHFGHARSFLVYDLSADGIQGPEARDVEHYCHGGHGDQSAMQKILATIADCDAVLVAKVGDGPKDKLAAIGVEAIDRYAWEEIIPSLQDFMMQRSGAQGRVTT